MYISIDSTFASFITVPEFAWGNNDTWERGQTSTPTAGGYTSVVDRGYYNRIISGMIPDITHAQMMELKAFFVDTLEWAKSTFYINTVNDEKSATWNQRETPFLYNTYRSGALIEYGDTYGGSPITYGQLIGSDYEIIGPLRLSGSGFKTIEKRQGQYDISIMAVLENAG